MEVSTIDIVKKYLAQYLSEKGLRNTTERFTILEEIYSRNDHFEADDLFFALKVKNFHISKATIYNTLDMLVEADLVVKHQFGNKIASKFEKSYGRKQHDHLICTDCQKVTEFCDPRIQNIQNLVNDTFECEIVTHSLTFYSKCKNVACKNKENKSSQ